MLMNKPAVRDAALLVLRLILGLVFLCHGVTKLFIDGMDETVGQFSALGVPQPQNLAWLTAVGELAGGALLVIGLLTTAAAAVLMVLVGGAFYFAHWGNGFFATEGGVEYVSVLFVALLMVVVFGAGRASLDEVLNRVDA